MTQTTHPIWQYTCLVCDNNLDLDKELNAKGKAGWEAYAVIRKEYKSGKNVYIAYLKRQKP